MRNAADSVVALDTLNSNTFQDDDYKARQPRLDRPADPAEGDRPPLRVRRRDERDRIAGPEDLAGARHELPPRTTCAHQERLAESPRQIYARIGPGQRLVLEYKFFERAFYHTDVPDWATSDAEVAALGDRAFVCLDTGHHASGTNIEFIVMQLLRLGEARLVRLQLTLPCR